MAISSANKVDSAGDTYEVEVFYDGDCPLCMREIAWLKRFDKHQRIVFTNIAAAEFSASDVDVPFDKLMARIHGRLPDGTIIEGVEVFRRLYAAVGWTLPVAASRLPGVRQVLDIGYGVFARNRLRFTGRCSADGDECAVKN